MPLMKKLFLLIAVLFCLSPGVKAQVTVADSFLCDGVWRSYLLYLPANYTPGTQRPLILNMHGLSSNAIQQQYYSNFMPIADTAGFLMAYPQGLSYMGSTYWNVGIPLTPPTNDVKFLSALIDTLSAHYAILPQQVYATGMSMGGYMSHYLALNLSNRIAAIASVTGSIFPGVYFSANPGRAVPMMQIHGTADSTVPYNGNPVAIPVDTLMKFWVTNNHCNSTPAINTLPNINTSDGCNATHYVYSGGTHGATCELYRIDSGAHTWPGSPFSIAVTNLDFNASVEIWRFFRQFRLNQFVSVEPGPAAYSDVSFYPNPCTDRLTVRNSTANGIICLTDITGKELSHTTGTGIDMKSFSPGLYLVKYLVQDQVIRTQKIVKE